LQQDVGLPPDRRIDYAAGMNFTLMNKLIELGEVPRNELVKVLNFDATSEGKSDEGQEYNL
jgi:hypothetical protein